MIPAVEYIYYITHTHTHTQSEISVFGIENVLICCESSLGYIMSMFTEKMKSFDRLFHQDKQHSSHLDEKTGLLLGTLLHMRFLGPINDWESLHNSIVQCMLVSKERIDGIN